MFDLKTALKHMRTLADKPERLRCFHKIVFEIGLEDPKEFWEQFWSIWQSSENLFDDFDYFDELVDYGLSLGSPHLGLEPKEQKALQKLPMVVTVYRGCLTDLNEDGWSWTTDREKARWFAGRSFGGEERKVLKGIVNKSDVLAYLLGRNESEIVVRPENVMDIEVEEEFTDKGNASSGIYWAIQSGRGPFAQNDKMDEVKALMQVGMMKQISDESIAEIESYLHFATWAELGSKKHYLTTLLKFMKMKRDDPESLPSLDNFQM